MANFQYYTAEALDKLKAELHHLKIQGRSDMAKQIAEARDKGDLSENAEYDAAKDAQRLQELADAGVGRDLPALFNSDRERESRYTRSAAGLRFDFSRQRITDDVLNELTALAEVIELPKRIAEMWRGDRINTTEDRAVLHVALRQDAGDAIGGAAIEAEVLAERERLLKFADSVREGAAFDHVINIGIGGSDLGPKFVVSALASGVRRASQNSSQAAGLAPTRSYRCACHQSSSALPPNHPHLMFFAPLTPPSHSPSTAYSCPCTSPSAPRRSNASRV